MLCSVDQSRKQTNMINHLEDDILNMHVYIQVSMINRDKQKIYEQRRQGA